MKNKILSIFSNTVPYVKELREYTDSVTSAILMQQLDYWFARKPQGFYKFSEPPKSENSRYSTGDSWTEELGFSAEELRTAFSKIGIAYKSKTEYKKSYANNTVFIDDSGKEFFYARYFDREKGCSFYYRNDELVDNMLDKLVFLETEDVGLRETEDVGLPMALETEDVGLQETDNNGLPVQYRDYGTETTSTKTKEAVDTALSVLEKSIVLELEVPQRIILLEELSRSDLEHIPHNYKLDYGVNNGKRVRRIPNSFQQRMLLLSSYLSNMPIAETKAGMEVKAAKELENISAIGTYTEERIYSSVMWGWINNEFDGKYKHGKNLRGVIKLLPKVPQDIKNNLYKSASKNLEHNKKEVIRNAAKASREFFTKHGITARPKL